MTKKRVVIIQKEPILHYRASIFNYFNAMFPKYDFHLTVLAECIQQGNPHPIEFDFIQTKIAFGRIIKYLNTIRPDVIVIFLGLRDLVIWPLLIYGRIRKITILTWGHPIDLSHPRNIVKNTLYSVVDVLVKGIILYASNDIKYIPRRQRSKVFVANNALNFSEFPVINKTKEQLRKIWNIPFSKTVLFAGRIHPRKKLDILINLFTLDEFSNFGLIIVGPDLPNNLSQKVESSRNMFYLGPVYDYQRINKIFKMADVFCIPGALGLAINQAFFWGLPVVTQKGNHGPEISYLKDGKNGYMAEDCEELKNRILSLLTDDNLYGKFSQHARKTILTEGSIERMTAGFIDALKAST